MKERPILFSTPMVLAILGGRKTMTRRILKPQIAATSKVTCGKSCFTPSGKIEIRGYSNAGFGSWFRKCPYGSVGDRLWVRETTCFVSIDHAPYLLEGMKSQTVYKTSVHPDWMEYAKEKYGYKWTPSIFMPRSASRITLEITNLRVERVQEITEEDAMSEGMQMKEFKAVDPQFDSISFRNGFIDIWAKINGSKSWNDNQWVWVIEFKVL